MIATSNEALVKSRSKQSNRKKNRTYSTEEIQKIVESGTSIEKAMLSEHFFTISGLYRRIILHYATFLTYSWLLVPHGKRMNVKMSEKVNQKTYFEASDFCSNFGIERHCAQFAKDVLVYGGYYGLIHDTGEHIAIQNLPFNYCRSRYKNSQDIDIVEFDMSFFDKEITDNELRKQILKTYPKVVQKGYRDYKKGGDNWLFLPSQIGIYFTLFEESPFFLDLIPLIDDLEDYREINKERNLLALRRIITQEIPHDGMKLVFEPEEAAGMHEGVVEMLSANSDTDVVTSYGKVNLLDMSGIQQERTDVEIAQQLIYDAAGVSKELFSATTDAGMETSLKNDLSMMMVLGYKFAHFFSMLVDNKFGTKKISLKVLILPISFYNADEYISKAKDLAAFGYSFLTPITSTGIDQTNLADLKILENDILKLKDVLQPLQSSYTQSGKTNAITAQAAKNAEKQSQSSSSDSSDSDSSNSEDSSNNAGTGGENEE